MKKNIYAVVIAAIFLLLSGQAFADQATVDASLAVAIKDHPNTTDNPENSSGTYEEKNVHKDVYLEPTKYPEFYKDISESPNCGKTLSGKSRWTSTTGETGHDEAKNDDPAKYLICGEDCLKSDCNSGSCDFSGCKVGSQACTSGGACSNVYFPCTQDGKGRLREDNHYLAENKSDQDQVVPGLKGEITIPLGYLKTSKVLFTWTVRVIGYKKTLAVWPFLCADHHGTSYQRFPAGQVKTMLFVKNKNDSSVNKIKNANVDDDYYAALGQTAQLTIPSAGTSSVSNPSDPTISGSYLLTKDDFEGGRLPTKIEYQVRWYNESSMRVMALKEQRNLVVMVIPVTEIKEEED